MTEPKQPTPGEDSDTAARPGLAEKAREVLARSAGEEPSVEATGKITPVIDGGTPAKAAAPAKAAQPAVAPAKTQAGRDSADVAATRASSAPRSTLNDATQAMPKVPAAPVTPPAPERPLFADAPRAQAPRVASAPATTQTATAQTAVAAPATAVTAKTPTVDATPAKARPASRKARLRLVKVDPLSVMKTSFLLSLAFGVVLFVAVLMIWLVLGAAGVWDSVNEAVKNFDETSTFDVTQYLGTGRVLGLTALVAVVDVVLMTALATLTAFLYNMSASLLGGVELTFAEERN